MCASAHAHLRKQAITADSCKLQYQRPDCGRRCTVRARHRAGLPCLRLDPQVPLVPLGLVRREECERQSRALHLTLPCVIRRSRETGFSHCTASARGHLPQTAGQRSLRGCGRQDARIPWAKQTRGWRWRRWRRSDRGTACGSGCMDIAQPDESGPAEATGTPDAYVRART